MRITNFNAQTEWRTRTSTQFSWAGIRMNDSVLITLSKQLKMNFQISIWPHRAIVRPQTYIIFYSIFNIFQLWRWCKWKIRDLELYQAPQINKKLLQLFIQQVRSDWISFLIEKFCATIWMKRCNFHILWFIAPSFPQTKTLQYSVDGVQNQSIPRFLISIEISQTYGKNNIWLFVLPKFNVLF